MVPRRIDDNFIFVCRLHRYRIQRWFTSPTLFLCLRQSKHKICQHFVDKICEECVSTFAQKGNEEDGREGVLKAHIPILCSNHQSTDFIDREPGNTYKTDTKNHCRSREDKKENKQQQKIHDEHNLLREISCFVLAVSCKQQWHHVVIHMSIGGL